MNYYGQNNYDYYNASSSQDQATSPYEHHFDGYHSYPLARDASSGGSSTASTIPESPMSSSYYHDDQLAVNYSAYQQDDAYPQDSSYQDYYSSAYSASSEATIVPQTDGSSSQDSSVLCLHAGCTAKPFKRTADLQRHYRNTHNPDSTKEAYFCDYPRCTRSQEPFRRRDHFRDHLREYHREDIQKRGVTVNEEWLDDRYYATNWWRCPRCLIRVYISKDDFDCPKCKGSCEPKRKEKRRSRS